MDTKYIIVACGQGSATSRAIALKLENYLGKHGVPVRIDTCSVAELRGKVAASKPDFIASATVIPDLGIPSISSIAFLTGVGVDGLYAKILATLADN
jgi:PTS system galactitol-specific IIB component